MGCAVVFLRAAGALGLLLTRAVCVAPPQAAEAGQAQPAAPAGQPEYDFHAQALVLKGNFIYEWSQMLAATGAEWRPVLDGAVALFREAKCPEKDIRGALRNHYRAAELDIPEEEPEVKEEPKAAEPVGYGGVGWKAGCQGREGEGFDGEGRGVRRNSGHDPMANVGRGRMLQACGQM